MRLTGRWSPTLPLLLSFLSLLAAAAAAAADDPFAEFRIPEHRVFSWTGNLSAGASTSDFSAPNGGGETGSASATLRSSAFWLRDSDPRMTFLAIDGAANGTRRTSESSTGLIDDTQRVRETSESWAISASQRLYPWQAPIGFELSASGSAGTSQFWLNDRAIVGFFPTISDQRQSQQRSRYQYTAQVGAALGVGRVRDATAVFDVLVFEDRLRAGGVLKGPLSPATRQRLAQLYYDRTNWYAVLDRPARAFWAAAIEILQKDESFVQGLDAVSLLRALEPYLGRSADYTYDFLPRSLLLRERGMFVGLAAQVLYSHTIDRQSISVYSQNTVNGTPQPPVTNELSDRFGVERQDVLVGPQAEWHRPLSPRWQADVASSYLIPTRGPEKGLRFVTSAAVGWIVADRWLATASFSHFRQNFAGALSGGVPGDAWGVSYRANLSWYLENHLSLSLGGSGGQSRQMGAFGRGHSISLSMGYRFAGALDYPGLTQPIRVP